MASSINASTTAGVVTTADTSGVLNIQTAGTTAVTVDTTTNVGIGTTSPSQRLHLNIGSATAIYSRIQNSAGDCYLGLDTSGNTNLSADNAGNQLIFKTQATERARFNATGALVFAGGTTTANGIGITFPATQSASSNANTLDDYEEGTWTPTIVYESNGTLSVGYSFNGGKYIKIGKLVYLTFDVRVSSFSKGTASGAWGFAGIPFTAENSSGYYNNVNTSVNFYQASFSAGNFPSISLNTSGSTVFYMYTMVDNAVNGNQLDPDSNAIYQGTLFYVAAN